MIALNEFFREESEGGKLLVAFEVGPLAQSSKPETKELYLGAIGRLAQQDYDVHFFVRPEIGAEAVQKIRQKLKDFLIAASVERPEDFYTIHNVSKAQDVLKNRQADIVIDAGATDWCKFRFKMHPESHGFRIFVMQILDEPSFDARVIMRELLEENAEGVSEGAQGGPPDAPEEPEP